MSGDTTSVACFGEALWDVLPKGIFLGGAPLNVAYHLARNGIAAIPISAVGRDFLGQELRRRVAGWGVDVRSIAPLDGEPTGTVRVEIDPRRNAHYTIARNVAWDRIPVRALLRRRAPAAVVYGTLALRSRENRAALGELFAAWPEAFRVLDLNLRPPFDRQSAVDFALRQAQLVKLNDHELALLAGGRRAGAAETEVRRFAQRHGLARVCVSCGSRGAGLLWHDTWHWENARPIEVRDTVGAGDAFLGGLLANLLRAPGAVARALAAGCRLGEFVAGRDGATPAYRVDREGWPQALDE